MPACVTMLLGRWAAGALKVSSTASNSRGMAGEKPTNLLTELLDGVVHVEVYGRAD